MTIELPEKAKAFVKSKVEAGHFTDETAAVTYILGVWQQWERHTGEVRAKVQEGVRAADEGRGTMIESPEEAAAFADTIKQRGRELEAERRRTAL